jgi:hypothetical protein
MWAMMLKFLMWETSIIQINRVHQHTAKTVEEKEIYRPGRFPSGFESVVGRSFGQFRPQLGRDLGQRLR